MATILQRAADKKDGSEKNKNCVFVLKGRNAQFMKYL